MKVDQAVNLADLKRLARRHAPRAIFDFIEGGADDEIGLATNRLAFERLRFVPRYLVDTSVRSQAASLFGVDYSAPFGIGPTGLNGLYRPGADLSLAAAAYEASIPFVMSNCSVASIEGAVRLAPGGTCFQLYGTRDRSIMMNALHRVADLGVKTLFYTVDVPSHSKRERNFRSGFGIPVRLKPWYFAEALLHPRWIWEYLSSGGIPKMRNMLLPEETARTSALDIARCFAREVTDPSQTWQDLETIRRVWGGKLVVKGVLHPDDARRSVDMGADGLLISNHGARQLDRAPSAIEMLPAIRACIDPKVPLMVDGGVSRGADVIAALCLGASFVFVGRATLYGAVAGRQRGVARAIAILKDEIDRLMVQIGCTSVDQFGPHLLSEAVRSPTV